MAMKGARERSAWEEEVSFVALLCPPAKEIPQRSKGGSANEERIDISNVRQ